MYLFGASGHGKVVAETAESTGIEIKGFIDDHSALERIWDYPVLRNLPLPSSPIFLSVGNNHTRKKIALRFPDVSYMKIIHANAYVSNRASIGEGTVVMSGVSLNADVQIGRHCILNTNSSVDHECIIGDYVHISPNVALAGGIEVGEGAHLGIGASVIQGVSIGKWAIVGAGAVVIRDVPDFAVVVGNPANIIKYNSLPG